MTQIGSYLRWYIPIVGWNACFWPTLKIDKIVITCILTYAYMHIPSLIRVSHISLFYRWFIWPLIVYKVTWVTCSSKSYHYLYLSWYLFQWRYISRIYLVMLFWEKGSILVLRVPLICFFFEMFIEGYPNNLIHFYHFMVYTHYGS